MNYLLDTHVFLWSLIEPKKISSKAIEAIGQPDAVVGLSIISIWEISLKYALGKLKLIGVKPDELPEEAERNGMEIVMLDPKDAASFYNFPNLHQDPFDRLLAWQAIKQKHTLISKDDQLRRYQRYGLKLLW